MRIENLSISELAELESYIPSVAGFPSRILARTSYSKWIGKLYEDIDRIVVKQIRPQASYIKNDPEDRFNMTIASSLNLLGYDAAHDTWSNGHPDILVKSEKGFRWIGESKIHSDYENLHEGFKQLCERYSSGDTFDAEGAVLIFSKNKDLGKMMKVWKNSLSSDEFYQSRNLTISDLNQAELHFFSEHNHTATSLNYKVKHIAISVYHEPIDKSARKRSKA